MPNDNTDLLITLNKTPDGIPADWRVLASVAPSDRIDKYYVLPSGQKFSSKEDAIAYEEYIKKHGANGTNKIETLLYRPREKGPSVYVDTPKRSKAYPHHESYVGPDFQAVVPPVGQNSSQQMTHPLNKCIDATLTRGSQRALITEPWGTLVWDCDILPDDVVDSYVQKCRAATPYGVRFDIELALQLLHECNYDVCTAYQAMRLHTATISLQTKDILNLTDNQKTTQQQPFGIFPLELLYGQKTANINLNSKRDQAAKQDDATAKQGTTEDENQKRMKSDLMFPPDIPATQEEKKKLLQTAIDDYNTISNDTATEDNIDEILAKTVLSKSGSDFLKEHQLK